MSLSLYRSQVTQATKKQGELQKKVGEQRTKIAKLQGDISGLMRGLTKSTPASIVQSKWRQVESKTKEQAKAEAVLGDLIKQQSTNLADLTRYIENRDRAEAQEQRRLDAEAKRRQQGELRHVQNISREMSFQRQLHSDMSRSFSEVDLAQLPEQISVLFLAAAPLNQDRLDIGEEVRLISEKLRTSEHREAIEFAARWAVRATDLQQALNETSPHLVHFSGHSDMDGIALHDEDGRTNFLSGELFAETLRVHNKRIQVVIFNSCYSDSQAKAMSEIVDVAIGMNASIGDYSARVFAGQFYSALGFGASVQYAFEQGVLELRLQGVKGADIPKLFARSDIDPDAVILVQPR